MCEYVRVKENKEIEREIERDETGKTGYIHLGYCHVVSLSSAAV